jgi:hypothetical protein
MMVLLLEVTGCVRVEVAWRAVILSAAPER